MLLAAIDSCNGHLFGFRDLSKRIPIAKLSDYCSD